MQKLKNTHIVFIQYLLGLVIITLIGQLDILVVALLSIFLSAFIGSSISYTIVSRSKFIQDTERKKLAQLFSYLASIVTSLLFLLFILFDNSFKELPDTDKITIVIVVFLAVIFIKYFNYYKFLLEVSRFTEANDK